MALQAKAVSDSPGPTKQVRYMKEVLQDLKIITFQVSSSTTSLSKPHAQVVQIDSKDGLSRAWVQP